MKVKPFKKKRVWMGQEKDSVKVTSIGPSRKGTKAERQKRWDDFGRWNRAFNEWLRTGKVDFKRMELVGYDENGKPMTIYEATAPKDFSFEFKKRDFGKFKPNPRKEIVGEMQFKDRVALKLICYHKVPLNQIKGLRRSVNGGMLVVDGGAHRLQLGLPFAKTKALIKCLRRLEYRQKRAPIHPRFSYVVRIDTVDERVKCKKCPDLKTCRGKDFCTRGKK
jgi:hypothetical protein